MSAPPSVPPSPRPVARAAPSPAFQPWQPRTSAGAVPVAHALSASAPLARLGERLRESSAMLESIRPALPTALASGVRAGPVDETGWSLLVAHAGAAAKLRQLVPRLEAVLSERGHAVTSIRIKVLPG